MSLFDTQHPAFSDAWLDELVDLHVLAAHGDVDAMARAASWLTTDPQARLAWDAVEQTCNALRTHTPGDITASPYAQSATAG